MSMGSLPQPTTEAPLLISKTASFVLSSHGRRSGQHSRRTISLPHYRTRKSGLEASRNEMRERCLICKASAPRRGTGYGTIEFNGGAIDCVLRNLSDTGAALEVASPLGIPAALNLLISGQRTTYPCEVRWRKENRIGAAFSRS
jgi:PilZ domain